MRERVYDSAMAQKRPSTYSISAEAKVSSVTVATRETIAHIGNGVGGLIRILMPPMTESPCTIAQAVCTALSKST